MMKKPSINGTSLNNNSNICSRNNSENSIKNMSLIMSMMTMLLINLTKRNNNKSINKNNNKSINKNNISIINNNSENSIKNNNSDSVIKNNRISHNYNEIS